MNAPAIRIEFCRHQRLPRYTCPRKPHQEHSPNQFSAGFGLPRRRVDHALASSRATHDPGNAPLSLNRSILPCPP